MFWRTKPEMDATSSDSNWPRNGAIHEGRWVVLPNEERWVHFENGFWLPEKQKGFTILFDITS